MEVLQFDESKEESLVKMLTYEMNSYNRSKHDTHATCSSSNERPSRRMMMENESADDSVPL